MPSRVDHEQVHQALSTLSCCPTSAHLFFKKTEARVTWTEMAGLESQEEDAPKSVLFYKPMAWPWR